MPPKTPTSESDVHHTGEGNANGGNDNNNNNNNKRPSTKEKLLQEITQKIEESKGLQEESVSLHRRAEEVAAHDPALAEDLRCKAREVDRRAARLLRTARRLESGWLQGGAAGAALGAGVAAGLGATVGALVGGLVAIPTAGLGVLVGAGAGLVHGPWVRFADALSARDVEEIDREAEEEARRIVEG
ncbi:hypothetical protein SAMD00023353_2500980 [Rosellinia necatrix]|uniref:Uncharacterized protein n=1 Tax=Rosellinia necatrix TaxID=77044 RepID=A0A1S8A8J9_ROSNE|nr:hypothetical protein SAMD00023353_2500980 [Rosellinia necatrix]